MKINYLFVLFIFLMSCSVAKKNIRITQNSIFANINELGTSKVEFTKKFGTPLSKDLAEVDGKKIECLYYVEVIDKLIVTTKFRFENDRLTEQSNQKMEYTDDKRLKELQDEVQRTRLQSFMNQMKN